LEIVMTKIGSLHCTLRPLSLLLCLSAYGCTADTSGSGVEGNQENSSLPGRDADGAERDAAVLDARAQPVATTWTDAGGMTSDAAVTGQPSVPARDGAVGDPFGALDASPGDAGVLCGTRGVPACGSQQFCSFAPAAQCGVADQGGVCAIKPQLCPQVYIPVCGCDSQTYSNSCSAHAAGVSVQHEGACARVPVDPSEPTQCGGFAGFACSGNSYCNYEVASGGQGCDGIADASGVCLPKVVACTKESRPVCGCDGRTYGSPCDAHFNEVSVAHEGDCKSAPTTIETDADCENAGGHVTYGIGPAAKCTKGLISTGPIELVGGGMPIEGAVCCLKP
jgi:hypothetical protein